MLLIIVLTDHEKKCHKTVQLKLEEKATIGDLKSEISSMFKIAYNAQQITDITGRQVDVLIGPVKDFGFEENDKLFLTHLLLDSWNQYMQDCKVVNDTSMTKAERTPFAYQALASAEKLEDSDFFFVYSIFREQWRNTVCEMMRFVDKTKEAFMESARTFFTKMYPNSEINFKPKLGGTRAGIVVEISSEDEITNFHMKTYHRAGSSVNLQSTSKRHLPDLREMLAYRLLERIGVGPIVFFPFYKGSTHIHYIATKGIKDFQELKKIEDISMQKKIVVEVYLLSLILGLRDLNDGNIGMTEKKATTIIDFYVWDTDDFIRPKIIDIFKKKSNFGATGRAEEIITQVEQEERMKIAKDALPNWKELITITSDIINTEKNELREHGIQFGTATNDVESYLQEVKVNYSAMCSAFE